MGTTDALTDGGRASFLSTLSMYDRYTFDETRVGFLRNHDLVGCQKELDLEPLKEYILIYNGDREQRKVIELDDTVDFARVMYELNTSIVRTEMTWGQRAHAALFDHRVNGLFYMIPEQLSE